MCSCCENHSKHGAITDQLTPLCQLSFYAVLASVGMNAYGVGRYWTHIAMSVGWYTDLVLQENVYDNIYARSVGRGPEL